MKIYSFKLSFSSHTVFTSTHLWNLTAVHTPKWITAPLPQISKPKFLYLSINPNLHLDSLCQQQQQDIRIINAPHGDDDSDMMDGSQLCIVPATQVSGDDVDTARVPFQSTLSTLSQGELLNFLSKLSEFFRSWSKRINRLASFIRKMSKKLSKT